MFCNSLNKGHRLVIDALIFKANKAYGYQEYLFNLLDYFYGHRELIMYNAIIIVCAKDQCQFFEKYKNKFHIIGYKIRNKVDHLVWQNLFLFDLKLKKSDTILFTYNYSSFLKRGTNVLVLHDLLFLRKNYLPNRLMRFQRCLSIPISLHNADSVIAISNFTKKDILNHYRKDKKTIFPIYNFFNFEKYLVKDSYYKCDNPYFISICSTAYHKNTISVLKSFELFCETNKDYHIIFIGSLKDKSSEASLYYEKLDESVKNRIHVLMDISNPELGMIYKNAKCFISLSLFEGLGMPIVEAMYFDLPLILSDLEICREIAQDVNAWYVDPLNISQVVSVMFDSIRQDNLYKSSEIVKERFSQENTSEKYISLLNSFIK